ncbi:MAG: hypothetical protein M3O46_05285 [Myxococcota bacterium]|nr:hypothetical protein [Myxococcota bacterium]
MITRQLRCRFVGALAAFSVIVTSGLAHAESTVVVLFRPAAGNGNASEVLNRARGELVADGFGVLLVDAVPEDGRVASITRKGHESGAAVAAGLFVADDASTIELCLVDELSGRVLVRRLDVQANSSEHAPEVLARRTVDLLRSSLLDFLVQSLRSSVLESQASRRPAPVVDRNEQSVESRWGIEAGLGVLGSFQGAGASIAPLARLRFAVNRNFQLRATASWFGTQPHVTSSNGTGTATIEQGVAVVECVARFWRSRWFRPELSMGGGTYYVATNGNGVAPYPSKQSSGFAAAIDAGLGVGTPIGAHFELLLELHAIVTAPGIAIRFLDADAARIGRPSLLSTLSLAGWI